MTSSGVTVPVVSAATPCVTGCATASTPVRTRTAVVSSRHSSPSTSFPRGTHTLSLEVVLFSVCVCVCFSFVCLCACVCLFVCFCVFLFVCVCLLFVFVYLFDCVCVCACLFAFFFGGGVFFLCLCSFVFRYFMDICVLGPAGERFHHKRCFAVSCCLEVSAD